MKIASIDPLPVLIKFLNDEEEKVKEAAGGVLANLALSNSCHNIMVEAGVIPKLVRHSSLLLSLSEKFTDLVVLVDMAYQCDIMQGHVSERLY